MLRPFLEINSEGIAADFLNYFQSWARSCRCSTLQEALKGLTVERGSTSLASQVHARVRHPLTLYANMPGSLT